MSSDSHKGDSGMNYQKLIKNLVVDGHMSFHEVLDLTPLQIAALMAENTIPPGEVDPDLYRRIVNG